VNLSLPSLDRVTGLPSDVIVGLRLLPDIAANTRVMARHTEALDEVAKALNRVADDAAALPVLRAEMGRVGEATAVLEGMDGRMAAIEAAMPVLVEVQQHLAVMPEKVGRVDEGLDKLNEMLERLLGTLDALNEGIRILDHAVEPVGRLARRVPGRRHHDED
jgi:phage-related minor tail protein